MDQDFPLTGRERVKLAAILAVAGLLVLAACSGCVRHLPRTSLDQDGATVAITVVCVGAGADDLPALAQHYGTGVIVGDHHVLTANHVASGPPGFECVFGINPGDGHMRLAEVQESLPTADIARLRVQESLAAWMSPIVLGPRPTVGDRVCESSAYPRNTYRCGTVMRHQDGEDGDIRIDMFTEFGNSGSGLYDARGRLVGIVVMTNVCQDGVQCIGFASSLWPRDWMLEE